jgi:hypothetical protein
VALLPAWLLSNRNSLVPLLLLVYSSRSRPGDGATRSASIGSLVTYEAFALDFSLTGVEVRPSPLSSTRNIVDVIFAYTNRNTDFTEKFFVRVDVTEEFPFLVTKLSPYYDR